MLTDDSKYAFQRPERFALDPDSRVPLYHQMEQIPPRRIVQPEAVGKLLPSGAELGEIFGVSRAMERLTFTTCSQPPEFARGVCRPDRYQFSIRLRRPSASSLPA